MGSTAVAAGLAHLLPTLERRCPGLLDPTYTLVAAARHCDLAGLQAAWGLLRQRLRSTLQQPDRYRKRAPEMCEAPDFWNEMLAAAAGSTTSCAIAKMEWVLKTGRPSSTRTAQARVCGSAAASGDLARLRWLRQRGFPWGTGEVLGAVLQHAEMRFILQLEQEGGYLPFEVATHDGALECAAGAPKDSGAKVQWLVDRGALLQSMVLGDGAVLAAARHGNLEALQLLMEPALAHNAEGMRTLGGVLRAAVGARSVPIAAWLHGVGCPLDGGLYSIACSKGDVPMLRWLLEVLCPLPGTDMGGLSISNVLALWSCRTIKDSYWLAEAVELMAKAGCPIMEEGEGATQPLQAALEAKHPWPVWYALRGLVPPWGDRLLPSEAADAAATGCEAVLEELMQMGVWHQAVLEDVLHKGKLHESGSQLAAAWYAGAAKNGDVGTLAVLRRIEVPLGVGTFEEVVRQGAPLSALHWLAQRGARASELELRNARGGGDRASYAGEVQEEEAWSGGLRNRQAAAAGRSGPQHSAGMEVGAGGARGGARQATGTGFGPGRERSGAGVVLASGQSASLGGRLLGLLYWCGLAVLLADLVLVHLVPGVMQLLNRLWS